MVPKIILVPVDYSETSEAALAYAVELGEALHARLVVMHAYELPVYGFPDGTLVATPEVATRIGEAARVGLEAIAARYKDSTTKINTLLREGNSVEEINAVAEEVKADLIIMGTHGRSGLARALMGSTAERILRSTSLPVLTVHKTTAPKTNA